MSMCAGRLLAMRVLLIPTSQRGRGVQAFRFMFLDGLEQVGVRVEQLPLVLPVVAGRNEQAAVLWQHRLHPPQPWKQVCHLETQRLKTANPRADGEERRRGTEGRRCEERRKEERRRRS